MKSKHCLAVVCGLTLALSCGFVTAWGHGHGHGEETEEVKPHDHSKKHGHSHGHDHGHEHVIDEAKAKERSLTEIQRLIKAGKLEESWSNSILSNTEKKKFKGKEEWVLTYKNDAATDQKKKELFVFLTGGGKFVAANHTGK